MAGTPVNAQSNTQGVPGVFGENTNDGVLGHGRNNGRGVVGVSDNHTGVEGNSTAGVGVFGLSTHNEAVHGISHSDSGAAAVIGINDQFGPGVRGVSNGFDGVSGTSLSSQHAGVAGSNDNGGIGVFGKGNPAGFFDGNVTITGHINNGGSDLTDQVVALQQQVALLQGAVAGLQH